MKHLALVALALLAVGCSSTRTSAPVPAPTAAPVAQAASVRAAVCCQEDEKVVMAAKGYGAVSSQSGVSLEQKKLMAIRAAKMDAYRNLAERVQGFRLSSTSSAAATNTQSDLIQMSAESYLRGARVVSVTPLPDGIYETLVEVELSRPPAGLVAGLSAGSFVPSAEPSSKK